MIIAAKGAVANGGQEAGLPYRWVGVGGSGNIQTSDSTTANSWTARTSTFGSNFIYDVASNGVDLYVAVGANGIISTSPDGVTWTNRANGFSTLTVYGIAYGNGYWIACGSLGRLNYSTDGITWTTKTTGTSNELYTAAFGNGLYVIAGGATLRAATDPTGTWTGYTPTLSDIKSHCVYYAPDQGIWVAGVDAGTTGALASSTDGTTWTARTSGFTINDLNGCFTSNGSVIVMGSTTTVLTPVCDVQSSTNGTTWTNRTPADTSEAIYCAAVDESGFIIVAGSKVQSTTDGVTWTDRGTAPNGFFAVCHSSGTPSIR